MKPSVPVVPVLILVLLALGVLAACLSPDSLNLALTFLTLATNVFLNASLLTPVIRR